MNDPLTRLIQESGIIPHVNTTNIFRSNEWSVLISPYYQDDISDSVRETDLIVEKQFNSARDFGTSSVQLNIQLFVECKYIKHEIVFWFDKMDHSKAVINAEKETNLVIAHKRSGDIVPTVLHQFASDIVAKLFSTNSNKDDVIYKAMNQCLHSQIHYRKTGKRPIFKNFHEHREVSTHVVQYPVIVCDNFKNLSQVIFDENGGFNTQELKNHFPLETNYRDDYFLIDIVDINYLETFLTTIEKEATNLVSSYSLKQMIRRSQ